MFALMTRRTPNTGRWYEAQREHLGIEFLDAVDATIDRIVAMPRAGSLVTRLPPDLPVVGQFELSNRKGPLLQSK